MGSRKDVPLTRWRFRTYTRFETEAQENSEMTHCPQYKTYKIWLIKLSGGSRGGARGPRAHPLFWVKKEEMTEGRKAGWASKLKPGPLLSLKSGSATEARWPSYTFQPRVQRFRMKTRWRGSFPFRKRSMPFSRHLEIFLTVNEFFSTKLKKKENLQVTT